MYGAIIGDMVGAPYEFDRGKKTKDFPLFIGESQFTDDSVMTAAVAEALLDSAGGSEETVKARLVQSIQRWGRRYPNAGYGTGSQPPQAGTAAGGSYIPQTPYSQGNPSGTYPVSEPSGGYPPYPPNDRG